MRRFLLISILFLTIPLFLNAEDYGFYVTTSAGYFSTPCKFKDEGNTNFSLIGGGIGFGITLFEDLSIEGRLGYSIKSFSGVTSFKKLPLELEEELNYSGIFLGFEAQYSNIFEYQDFGLSPFVSFYYGSTFEKEWNITLPIVKGKAKSNSGWLKGGLGAKILYNGLDLHTPYLGVYLSKTSGSLTMKEEIEEIIAKQERKFVEKIPFIISIGDDYEIIEDLYLNGEVRFGGEFSISLNLKYIIR
jgi:hypothetical protein